jgi:hypothetical protein
MNSRDARSPDLVRMLTSEQAAIRMGRTDRWLRNQRRLGLGPPYIRYNGWQPLYDPDAVDAWVKAQLEQPEPATLRLHRG